MAHWVLCARQPDRKTGEWYYWSEERGFGELGAATVYSDAAREEAAIPVEGDWMAVDIKPVC